MKSTHVLLITTTAVEMDVNARKNWKRPLNENYGSVTELSSPGALKLQFPSIFSPRSAVTIVPRLLSQRLEQASLLIVIFNTFVFGVSVSSGWAYTRSISQTCYTCMDLDLYQERPHCTCEQVCFVITCTLQPITANVYGLRSFPAGETYWTTGDIGKEPNITRVFCAFTLS